MKIFKFTILMLLILILFHQSQALKANEEKINLSSAQKVEELKQKIKYIDSICVPKKGTNRDEIENIFGQGKVLPPRASKLPFKEEIPENSPRRSYQLFENCTLVVRYDSQWKVLFAHYTNPYSTKGRDKEPSHEELLFELEPRLEQMKIILEEYNKKIKNLKLKR